MSRELWKGNEAIAEAAIRGGVEAYFGYPITPQTELLEYMSWRMPELGRVFLQAESEVASINMVYGAASGGARAMTSSSSPGISLMQEGLSYIAASQIPAVLIDVMRGGPGLGNIQPSQSDYFQMTRSAGHGDFHPIVLAPSTVQEAVDLMYDAFPLAEKYRTLVILAADGSLGQMMEPAEMPPMRAPLTEAERGDFAIRGAAGRDKRIVTSLFLNENELEDLNRRLQAKLRMIEDSRAALGRARHVRRRVPAGGVRLRGAHVQDGREGSARRGHQSRPAAPHLALALPAASSARARRGQARHPGGRDERGPDAGGCPVGRRRPLPGRFLRPDRRRDAAAGRNPGRAASHGTGRRLNHGDTEITERRNSVLRVLRASVV